MDRIVFMCDEYSVDDYGNVVELGPQIEIEMASVSIAEEETLKSWSVCVCAESWTSEKFVCRLINFA